MFEASIPKETAVYTDINKKKQCYPVTIWCLKLKNCQKWHIGNYFLLLRTAGQRAAATVIMTDETPVNSCQIFCIKPPMSCVSQSQCTASLQRGWLILNQCLVPPFLLWSPSVLLRLNLLQSPPAFFHDGSYGQTLEVRVNRVGCFLVNNEYSKWNLCMAQW